jgi:hypothetical protein
VDKANYVSLLSDLRAAFDSTPVKYGRFIQHTSRVDLTCIYRFDGNAAELILVPQGKHF